MDIAKLSRDSHDLLERLADRFPPDQLDICRDLDRGGEFDELIDVMCAVLVKRSVPITPDERDALAALLSMYPLPHEDNYYIDNRDQTLADLTVTD